VSKDLPIILDPPAGDPYCHRVRWYDHVGRKRQKTYRGHDEKTGRAALAKAKAKVAELIGKQQRGIRTTAARTTVAQLVEEVFENVWDAGMVATSTRNDVYAPCCKHRIIPYLGAAEIGTVDRKTVQGFIAWMKRQGCSNNTIGTTLTVLSAVFAAAVEWDYLATNPVHGVKRPTIADPGRQAYEPLEVLEIAAGMRCERDAAMVVFAAFSGLRQSEVWALEREDVDAGPLELAEGAEPHMRVFRKKTQEWDEVPLFEPARLALLWHLAATPNQRGLVFQADNPTTKNRAGSLMKQKSAWHRRWWRPGLAMAGRLQCANAACKAPVPATDDAARRIAVDPKRGAERWRYWHERQTAHHRDPKKHRKPVGPKPVEPWACAECGEREVVGPVFHELRHTFGSIAVAATGDTSQVAEWGGWASTRMLDARYKKQLRKGRKRAVAQVNNLVSEWSAE
jgi:integrase